MHTQVSVPPLAPQPRLEPMHQIVGELLVAPMDDHAARFVDDQEVRAVV